MNRSKARRREVIAVAALLLCAAVPATVSAQEAAPDGALNTIPTGEGYGAADAGRTGKLPPGPAPGQFSVKRTGKPGHGGIAGAGGPATGAAAGASVGSVETGGTEGAGSR